MGIHSLGFRALDLGLNLASLWDLQSLKIQNRGPSSEDILRSWEFSRQAEGDILDSRNSRPRTPCTPQLNLIRKRDPSITP